MKKGFISMMVILVLIVIIIALIYMMGWRLVFNPSSGAVSVALNPQGAFGWLGVWVQQLLGG
jgi:uncharacterized protein (UPF0333 family)